MWPGHWDEKGSLPMLIFLAVKLLMSSVNFQDSHKKESALMLCGETQGKVVREVSMKTACHKRPLFYIGETKCRLASVDFMSISGSTREQFS